MNNPHEELARILARSPRRRYNGLAPTKLGPPGLGLGELLRRTARNQDLKAAVWEKGRPVQGYDPDEWRYDDEGSLIAFSAYGRRDSAFGWEIDHITPVSQGGSDDLSNLRPLHWEANAKRGGSPGR